MKSSRVCWRPGPTGFSRNKYTQQKNAAFTTTPSTTLLTPPRLQLVFLDTAASYERQRAASANFVDSIAATDVAAPLELAKLSAALIDCQEQFGVRTAFAFSSSNRRAVQQVARAALTSHGVAVGRVSGRMPAKSRAAVMDPVRRAASEPAEEGSAAMSIVTNCRVLAEGVDLPAVDLVVFADAKHSHVDILQVRGVHLQCITCAAGAESRGKRHEEREVSARGCGAGKGRRALAIVLAQPQLGVRLRDDPRHGWRPLSSTLAQLQGCSLVVPGILSAPRPVGEMLPHPACSAPLTRCAIVRSAWGARPDCPPGSNLVTSSSRSLRRDLRPASTRRPSP